jgi:hypothetical protein
MPPFFLSRLGADKTALRSLKRQGRFQQMGTRPAFCGAGPLHWTAGPAVNSKGTRRGSAKAVCR